MLPDDPEQRLFLALSLYIFVVLAYSAIYQMNVNSWPSVTGKLLKFGIWREPRMDTPFLSTLDVAYEYVINDKKYTGTRVSPWAVMTNVNEILDYQLSNVEFVDNDYHVNVYYNPDNPAKSFLVRTGRTSQLCTFALALIPIIFYFINYH